MIDLALIPRNQHAPSSITSAAERKVATLYYSQMEFSPVAVHEAGHAVAVLALGERINYAKCNDKDGSVHWQIPDIDGAKPPLSAGKQLQVRNAFLISVAGRLAVSAATGKPTNEALAERFDLLDEERYAELLYPDHPENDRSEHVRSIMREAWNMLREHWDATSAIAEALSKRGRLEREELEQIFHAHPKRVQIAESQN